MCGTVAWVTSWPGFPASRAERLLTAKPHQATGISFLLKSTVGHKVKLIQHSCICAFGVSGGWYSGMITRECIVLNVNGIVSPSPTITVPLSPYYDPAATKQGPFQDGGNQLTCSINPLSSQGQREWKKVGSATSLELTENQTTSMNFFAPPLRTSYLD